MNLLYLFRSKHIQILFLIFLIVSTLSSFLWLLSDSLKRNFNFTASEVLGADGTIESGQILPKELYDLAKKYPVDLSQTINFTSMAIAEKSSALAHIRAIEKTYPLKGQVQIKAGNNLILNRAQLLPSQIWIDQSLKTRLGVKLQGNVQLGAHNFQLAGIILSEPARAGMSFILAPKIIMRIEDVEKTGLIQPYARVLYQLFVKAENKAFVDFTQQVKNKFSTLKIYSVQEGRPFANAIFDLAERYMGIFIVITVMLSGIGMMVLSQAFSRENVLTVALLKTFGISLKKIGLLYFLGFIIFGLAIIVLSIGIAVLGVIWLNYLYPDYIAFNAQYLMSWNFGKIVFIQISSSLIILFGFSFVPIFQTLKISPIYLLRKRMISQSTWPVYLIAAAVMLILLMLYIQNYLDVLMFFSYILIATTLLYMFFYTVLSGAKILPLSYIKILVNSRKLENSLLMTKFSVLFLLTALLWVISNDFFGHWISSIPENAPNQFMINITDNNKNDIQAFWKNRNIDVNLSPMLTARLKSVNNQPRHFHRTLNISYMNKLPVDNKIISGEAWNNELSGETVISIEQNFAKNIQAEIGDTLSFDIGGQEITGKIINSRSLKWESFSPNFYVIFPEKVLEGFPKTYITSIYLPANQLEKTTEFLKRFPAVTIIDINLSLDQVKTVLIKVTTALKYLVFLIGVLACLVYYAITSITFFERQYESVLLRSFGASKIKLTNLILLEFGLIGGLSGGFGVTGAIILAILLSKQLRVTYHPNGWFILVGIGLGASLTMMIGWLTTYKVVKVSPLVLLKETPV